MFFLQKTLAALILPPACLVMLIAAGLLMGRRWPRIGATIVWTALLCLTALSLPITSSALLNAASSVEPFDRAQATGAQAIVILAGGRRAAPEFGGETVSYATLQRLRYGAMLARDLHLPVLVTGGAVFRHGEPEAHLMARALQESFQTEVKWLEDRSRNTHENARYSAELLHTAGIKRVVLVTHDIHQRRSMAEFQAAGVETIPASVILASQRKLSFPEQLPNAHSLASSSLALHELIGYLALTLRGRAS